MITFDNLYNKRPNNTTGGFFSQLLPSTSGQPSASSIGSTPFGRPRFDFSLGVPPSMLGVGFTRGLNGEFAFSPRNTNPNSYDMKFGPTNANSPFIKYGTPQPGTEAAFRTPVDLDMSAKLLAGGGNLVWDSLHGQWSISGGLNLGANDPRLGAAYDRLNLAQQPRGTLALNNLLRKP